MNRTQYLVFTTLLVVALGTPLVSLYVGSQLSAADEPAVAISGEFTLDHSKRELQISVDSLVERNDGATAYAPHWEGVVSAVHVQAGDLIESGNPVFDLNGVEIRYYASATPIYEQVCEGNTRLVTSLRDILETSGHAVGSGDKVDRVDRTAIRAYAQSIGVAGYGRLECFDPSWIITSAEPMRDLAEVNLSVGAFPPSPASPVLAGRGLVQEVALLGSDGSPLVVGIQGGQVGVPADAEVRINGVETGLILSEIYPTFDPQRVSEWFTEEGSNNVISLTTKLTEGQYLVPATSVVNPLGVTSCLQSVDGGSAHEVTVIGSTMNGLIIEFDTNPTDQHFRLEPDQSLCG